MAQLSGTMDRKDGLALKTPPTFLNTQGSCAFGQQRVDPSKVKKNSSGNKREQALPGLLKQGPPQDVSGTGKRAEPCLQVSVLICAYTQP